MPDSLLKDFGAYVLDNVLPENHVIAANEGSAVALAAGYHFATSKVGMVYLQNSGLGNTINPLLSLADPAVYAVPMLLLVGWRGEPGTDDEPQHAKQGLVTRASFEAMGVPCEVLESEEVAALAQMKRVVELAKSVGGPVVLLVKKGSFAKYSLQHAPSNDYSMSRETAIEIVVTNVPKNTAIVSTTGKASRELFEIREKHNHGHASDFLTVGSMGHAGQIALSIAVQKKEKPVVCLDGDGAFLMHMGSAAVISTLQPKNFLHIVLNNGVHDSVGGQPTCAFNVDLGKIAAAFGYKKYLTCANASELSTVLKQAVVETGPVMLEVRIKAGARSDLGRPTTTPVDNKNAFMEFVQS